MNEYWRPQRNINITSHLHFQKPVSPASAYTSVVSQVHISMVCFAVQIYFVFLPQNPIKAVTTSLRLCLIFQLFVPQIQFKSLIKNS